MARILIGIANKEISANWLIPGSNVSMNFIQCFMSYKVWVCQIWINHKEI